VAKAQDGRHAQGQGQAEIKTRRARKRETLFGLTNKTNWQQTNRDHRYKYPGDNGEDGQHLEDSGDMDK
jgi:hypothetical protein